MLIWDKRVLTVAFADADVVSYTVNASRAERRRLVDLIAGLQRLGRVASWSVRLPSGPHPFDRVVDAVAGKLGRLTVEAVLGSAAASSEPAPERLMPVWPFDHMIDGAPAATARIGALDLEMRASRSTDEECGIVLPGRQGLWTVSARTIGC